MNAYDIVRDFEKAMCEYTGAPHAVAVDTGTAAIHLCLEWHARELCRGFEQLRDVFLPRHTYVSVPCAVIHTGGRVRFRDSMWQKSGVYCLEPYSIADSACYLSGGMYIKGLMMCLSFQSRKHLKIGRGGMVLTDDAEAAKWLRLARFSGRHEVPLNEDPGSEFPGWHCFMEPERAARGLALLMDLPKHNEPLRFEYPDLSTWGAFK